MGKKLDKASKKLLKEVASKLPIYPKRKNEKEFVCCHYPILGKVLAAQGGKVKGDGNPEPNVTYYQEGYAMVTPYEYLLDAVVKKKMNVGDATKAYLDEYAKVEVLLAKIKKENNANVPETPRIF